MRPKLRDKKKKKKKKKKKWWWWWWWWWYNEIAVFLRTSSLRSSLVLYVTFHCGHSFK
jgi:hypothetical protein